LLSAHASVVVCFGSGCGARPLRSAAALGCCARLLQRSADNVLLGCLALRTCTCPAHTPSGKPHAMQRGLRVCLEARRARLHIPRPLTSVCPFFAVVAQLSRLTLSFIDTMLCGVCCLIYASTALSPACLFARPVCYTAVPVPSFGVVAMLRFPCSFLDTLLCGLCCRCYGWTAHCPACYIAVQAVCSHLHVLVGATV